MRTFPISILLVLPLAAVATAGILAAVINRDGRSPVEFDGVDHVALAETGVTLVEPPPGTNPHLSAEEASAYAEKYSDTVKEIRLAQLSKAYEKESASKLVWAVSLDPSGRHFMCAGFDSPKTCASPRFLIQFIDANTGEFLYSVMH